MPRMPSAAVFKGKTGGYRQDEPRHGTMIRNVYDLFVASPGIPVPIDNIAGKSRRPLLNQLQDIYGLDIRLWRYSRPAMYVLAGRWNGNDYEDFLPPERLEVLRKGAFMPDRA